MLIDKRVARVSSRKTRRNKDEENSESDHFDDDIHLLQGVRDVSVSQATTQPFDVAVSLDVTEPTPVCATSLPSTTVRKRSTQVVCQRSSCTL